MHPIFQNWKLFLLYLAAWVPLGAMLGLLISVAGALNAAETAAIIAPVTVVLAFICLSPWYACRALPLRSANVWRLLGQHLLAAMVVAAGVLMVVRGSAVGFSNHAAGTRPAIYRGGSGVHRDGRDDLPALDCDALCCDRSAVVPEVRTAGARSAIEGTEGAGQSALPVQQSEFDQRVDGERCVARAGDVYPAGRFPAHFAPAGRARRLYPSGRKWN